MTVVETDNVLKLEFKWGNKSGVGGRKKEIQFYESFTYDGVDYSLYDSVYIHKEGESEPYIGKIIKIWENEDKTKKVKLQWFFRPYEILERLGNVCALENEIFLASGEGIGLANVTPLEGISGKCNVVCTSKNIRNHQPSAEDIKMADYIFYRTFDVQLYTILDIMDDKVGELEVRFVFNRKESETVCVRELVSDEKEDNRNAVACNGEEKMSIIPAPDDFEFIIMNGDNKQCMAVNDVKDVLVKCENLTDAKPASVSAGELKKPATAIGQEACPMGEKFNASKAKAVNNVLERAIDSTVAGKTEKDDLIKSSVRKDSYNAEKLILRSNDVNFVSTTADASVENTKFGYGGLIGQEKVVILEKEYDDMEDKLSKKTKAECPSNEKTNNKTEKTSVTYIWENVEKLAVSSVSDCSKNLGTSRTSFWDGTKSKVAMKSFGLNGPYNTKKVDDKVKYSGCKLPKKPVIKVVSTTVDTSRENTKSGHVDPLGLDKGVKIDRKPDNLEGKPSKKVKVECTGKEKLSNIIEKIIVDSDISCAKNVVTCGTFNGERTKSKVTIDSNGLQGPSNKDKLNDKMNALSNVKLPKMTASVSACGDSETKGNISDIPGRPDALFKNRVQSAQKDGKILVLHNFDPEYVSVEVEEIIWHSFKEHCLAKVVHQTTIFPPLSGQAIVIFKTREGTERVMRKLAEGCLMLPNGRPLVCSIPPTFSENQPTYYGHLVIDKKNQLQRETKDSVSTSHCSLPYTIEYNMAMEWCLLQLRSDGCWNRLHKRQRQEISKLMAKFKSK